MKPRPLIISESERAKIKDAITRARAKPISWESMREQVEQIDQSSATITLQERERAGFDTRPLPAEHIDLPVGYRLNISYEQQPAGLCLHLSMSVDEPGKMPHPAAMGMIIHTCGEACGADWPADLPQFLADNPTRAWIEDFLVDGKPGGHAFNVVIVMDPAPIAGHA